MVSLNINAESLSRGVWCLTCAAKPIRHDRVELNIFIYYDRKCVIPFPCITPLHHVYSHEPNKTVYIDFERVVFQGFLDKFRYFRTLDNTSWLELWSVDIVHFLTFFSVRLLLVLRGHSVFSSPPQRPMTINFEGFSIPDFIHYIYFPILILEKELIFSLLNVQC